MSKQLSKPDSRGVYPCEKGGHKFYLGTDKRAAEDRKSRLERLWQLVKGSGWDSMTLDMGKAIARGEPYQAEGLDQLGTLAHAVRLARLQAAYPMVAFAIPDDVASDQVNVADQLQDQSRQLRTGSSNQTLFQALTAYGDWLKTDKSIEGQQTEDCHRLLARLALLKNHHQDMPLSAWDNDSIDGALSHWKNRPMTKKGKPASKDTCEDCIKLIRRFNRWLNRTNQFAWTFPPGYEIVPVRIAKLESERVKPVEVKKYSVDQLRILFQAATPLERILILLALNCSFGRREIATLTMAEIQGRYIKRHRKKTGVYGEWLLWNETFWGLHWYIQDKRPASQSPYVFVTANGNSYFQRTVSGNPNQRIANLWKKLLDRVCKDHKDFPRLSFNKLRKTSGNMIRQIASGETMRVFQSRGKAVKNDDQAERYSDRAFKRVFRAQLRMKRKLRPMFAAVETPFHNVRKTPAISLGTIQRIKDLLSQGLSAKAIADQVGVSDDTVRRYGK